MAKIILVGGGTASGKTYVINEVVKLIGEENVAHLSIDDYYKDLTSLTMEERIKVNYDHPKAFDWPLIKKQLIDLKNDKTILKPIYDFHPVNQQYYKNAYVQLYGHFCLKPSSENFHAFRWGFGQLNFPAVHNQILITTSSFSLFTIIEL